MDFLVDAHVLSALERARDVVARRRVVGQLEHGLPDLDARTGQHLRPVDARDGEVLADRAGPDGMAFGLQRGDEVERVKADGAFRAAVIAQIALPVALQPVHADVAGLARQLRHAAARDVDGMHDAHQSAATSAAVTSLVRAVPPRSGVNTFFAVTVSIAFMMRAAAFGSPRCSSIIDAVQKVAIGLATPLPAMSNAEPWIGSNIDGNLRSGLRLAVGAMPSEPDKAAARSERMSACRLDATTVSIDCGRRTMRVVIASTRMRSVFTSGKSFATRAKISSHSTMPWRWAFDFVTSVRCFLGRLRASSNAKRCTRSTPLLVKVEISIATSLSSPVCTRPPAPEYSPSVFSRTMTQSISLPLSSGERMPGSTRAGRTFAY